jgi:hypothetical protein
MAKDLFVTQWFSREMRTAGERLVKRLQESGGQVAAAFWILNPDAQKWELTIVSPLVKIEGPKAYYKRIDDIYKSAEPDEEIVSLHDIQASNTNNKIVNAIKHSPLKSSTLGNNRFGKNTIGNVYIEDMYLYLMDWNLLTNN